MIADSEIISSGIKRFYLKDDQSVSAESLVKLKLVTTEDKVQKVFDSVQENNLKTNQTSTPMMAMQLTGGSEDYADWVNA